MKLTPFQEPACREWLGRHGVNFVASPDDATWIVADIRPRLLTYAARFGTRKRYLFWTHEPRRDVALAPPCRLGPHAEARVHVVEPPEVDLPPCLAAILEKK